jgi:hypothetical protein
VNTKPFFLQIASLIASTRLQAAGRYANGDSKILGSLHYCNSSAFASVIVIGC